MPHQAVSTTGQELIMATHEANYLHHTNESALLPHEGAYNLVQLGYNHAELPLPPMIAEKTVSGHPTKADWRRIKPIFVRLYFHEEKHLKDVVNELEQKHWFRASENMFKKRINAWSLDRRLKQHEVERILGILAQREAQRKAQHKDTVFFLRRKQVDMQNVFRYVRRKGLSVRDLEARYRLGQSKSCPDLQVVSPKAVQPWSSPPAAEDALEWFLYEGRILVFGLLDAGLCKVTDRGISYGVDPVHDQATDLLRAPWKRLRTHLDIGLIRRLGLLLEEVVRSHNLGTLRDVLHMLTRIVQAGHERLAQSCLDQLRSLIKIKLSAFSAQFRFLQQMARLHPAQTTYACLALCDLYVNIHVELRPYDAKFQLRSKFILQQLRFDLQGQPFSPYEFLDQHMRHFGPLHLATLALLSQILGSDEEALINQTVEELLFYLIIKFEHLKCECPRRGLVFDGIHLQLLAAEFLAKIYELVGAREQATWVFETILICSSAYRLSLDVEYGVLEWLVHLRDCTTPEEEKRYRERMLEIRDIWANELEAAVPDESLAAACRGSS